MGQEDRVSSDGSAITREEDPSVSRQIAVALLEERSVGRERVRRLALEYCVSGDLRGLLHLYDSVRIELIREGFEEDGFGGERSREGALYIRVSGKRSELRMKDDRIRLDGFRDSRLDDSIGVEPTDTDPFDPSRSLDGA